MKSDSGGTLALRFALAGDTLTLTWPDGSARTFRRER